MLEPRVENWRTRRFSSIRALVFRQLLKLSFRYWLKRKTIDMVAIRKREQRLSAFIPMPPKRIQVKRLNFDGTEVHRLVNPQRRSGGAILYLHGGGYIACSPMTSHRDFIWRLAESCATPVFALNYRKAPQAPFPAAIEDAERAYRTLLSQFAAESIGVVGDSAGGGLTLALAHKLRDSGIRLPAAMVALSPWTDLANQSGSIQRNKRRERMVPTHLLDEIAALYVGEENVQNPYISPLYGDFRGFPPTLLLASDTEVLSDDAVRVTAKMRKAGVPVVLQMWRNMPHVWPLVARFVPESQAALAQVTLFLQGHLQPLSSPG